MNDVANRHEWRILLFGTFAFLSFTLAFAFGIVVDTRAALPFSVVCITALVFLRLEYDRGSKSRGKAKFSKAVLAGGYDRVVTIPPVGYRLWLFQWNGETLPLLRSLYMPHWWEGPVQTGANPILGGSNGFYSMRYLEDLDNPPNWGRLRGLVALPSEKVHVYTRGYKSDAAQIIAIDSLVNCSVDVPHMPNNLCMQYAKFLCRDEDDTFPSFVCEEHAARFALVIGKTEEFFKGLATRYHCELVQGDEEMKAYCEAARAGKPYIKE